MSYSIHQDGKVVSAEGENIPIVTDPDLIDLAIAYETANAERKRWQAQEEALKSELREHQTEGTRAYGDLVLTVRSDPRQNVDVKALADYLYDNPVEVSDLLGLIAASKGLKLAEVPAGVADAVGMMTETTHTSPYYVASIARRAAPVKSAWERRNE